MLVPDEMRKGVVFVYLSRDGALSPAGTAFFMADRLPENELSTWGYLLTAHHVIEGVKRHGDDGKVHLRLNVRGGGSRRLSHQVDEWIHPDKGLDFSILPWEYLPELNLDWRAWMLPGATATAEVIEREGIGLGDEVFMVGLFSHHLGGERNEPILRVGNIAGMPAEGVSTRDYGQMPAVLIEARSIGGLSGSPVFVHVGLTRWREGEVRVAGDPTPFFFLGAMHGHWNIADTDSPVSTQGERINSGIGIVVPAENIVKALQPLREYIMEKRREARREQTAATPDDLAAAREPPPTATADMMGKLLQVPKGEADEVHRSHGDG